jgi:uncharacterized protein YndB with AHSA1/START domain
MAGPCADGAPRDPGGARLTGPRVQAVERTIRISARPETVWRFWTDPERISDWWGSSAELDPRPGGACVVRLGGDAVMRGEFVELVPCRRIVFTLGWDPADGAPPVAPGSSTVTITLTEDDGETILTLRHTGLPPAARDQHRAGWSHFLPMLADAAGRPGAQAREGR